MTPTPDDAAMPGREELLDLLEFLWDGYRRKRCAPFCLFRKDAINENREKI
mgnify:FL=1